MPAADPAADPSDPAAFIAYWSRAGASERANAQPFLLELADELGVPRPDNSHLTGYSFEFPVQIPPGSSGPPRRIDLYKRGCFVLEAKQFTDVPPEQTGLTLAAGAAAKPKKTSAPVRGSGAWDDAMIRARYQAETYARALPADEPPPPSCSSSTWATPSRSTPISPRRARATSPSPIRAPSAFRLADLADPAVRERLRRIWLDPLSLDPAKISAAVTREIAGYLAVLAASLEQAGHAPRRVADFLTRCLFCMFADDVGLLPRNGFLHLLESLRATPEGFVPKLRQVSRT